MKHKFFLPIFLYIILFIGKIYTEESESYDLFANLEGIPSTIVNGSVNVISGAFIDSSPRINVPGRVDLSFESTYIHQNSWFNCNKQDNLCDQWDHDFSNTIVVKRKPDYWRMILLSTHRPCLNFKTTKYHDHPKGFCLSLKEQIEKKTSYTNTSKGTISGLTNCRNDALCYDTKNKKINLYTCENDNYLYGCATQHWEDNLLFKLTHIYRLDTQTYRFLYQSEDKKKIWRVENFNSNNESTGQLLFDYGESAIRVSANDVSEVCFHLDESQNRVHHISSNRHPSIFYDYEMFKKKGSKKKFSRISKKELPLGRFLKVGYHTFRKSYKNAFEENKVAWQAVPKGHDTKSTFIYRFRYFKNKDKKHAGFTDVYDAYSHVKRYEYANNKLTSIARHTGCGDYRKYSSESFHWAEENQDICNLRSKTIYDAVGCAKSSLVYFYDLKGNVVEQQLHGNLTGEEAPSITMKHGHAHSQGAPYYSKSYSYSNPHNLLLKENDGRKETTYAYHETHKLLEKKFIWNAGHIAIRYFYAYDVNGAITEEIVDDGCTDDKNDLTGVSQRIITTSSNTMQIPVGLPEEVIQSYLDMKTGSLNMLSKKTYVYTAEGQVSQENIYDGNGILAQTMSWKYDGFGNVIEETNPLGQTVVRQYDELGNLIYEKGARPEVHKEYQYDFNNRLIAEEEVYVDGQRLKRSYRYDNLGNKIADIDVYGNETLYKYDEFSRLIEVQSPKSDECNHFEYDIFDHQTAHIDSYGNVTKKEFTIRGQMTKLTYPDGREERTFYSLDGAPTQTIAADGTVTKEKRDYQKRIIEKAVFSKEGEFLFKTSCEYSAFHLLKEYDAAGNATHYEYDSAGRKIKVISGDTTKEIFYDAAGHIAKTITYASETDGMVIEYEYDIMNRITKERTSNLQGVVQKESEFQYDCDGNRCATITSGIAGISISQEEYNFHKTITRTVDPEGKVTVIQDKFDFYNDQGQRVAYREVIDPLGHVSITIKDITGKDAQIVSKDAFGNILHQSFFKYDANGKKIERTDHVYHDVQKVREVTTKWIYDSSGRLTCKIDALGTPLQKELSMTYNSVGEKESVRKYDGTLLTYKYGPRGILQEIKSSDHSINYSYEYDQLDNPIRIADLVAGTVTEARYDRHKQIVYEKLANGLEVSYTYDGFGREKRVILPDHSAIEYRYEGSFLKRIDRLNPDQTIKYHHDYVEYDKRGMLIRSDLAYDVGTLAYDYDLIGRLRHTESEHWREVIAGFDDAGNLTERELSDSVGTKQQRYHYDKLYQLISDSEHDYRYDSLHNRIQKNKYTHNVNALNQIACDGYNTYQYDLNGNMKVIDGRDHLSLNYDALDRLISVETTENRYSYTYDAKNRRMSKSEYKKDFSGHWVKVFERRYLYQGNREIGAANTSGEVDELRILGYGRRAENSAAVTLEIQQKVYIPIHDSQGNIATLLSEQGQVVETYRYSAFGEEVTHDAHGNHIEHSINPWHFSSKRSDTETGFIYFGCRYYSPDLGKWISPDPIGDREGPNLYAYVKNSPMTLFDAYGLYTENQTCPSIWDKSFSEYMRESCMRNQNYFMQSIKDPGEGISYFGRNLEMFSKHVGLPSPFKYAGERLGQLIQGKSIDYTPAVMRPVDTFVVNPEGKAGIGCVLFAQPGILSEHENAYDMALSVSNAYKGAPVTAICNPTLGGLTDMSTFMFKKMGMITPVIREIAKKMTIGYNQAKLEIESKNLSMNPRLFPHVHSRAATELKYALELLPPHIQKCVHIRTYGGGDIIHKKNYGSAVNFMNPWDPNIAVTWYDCAFSDDVTFTDQPPNRLNIFENHYIMNQGYQDAIQRIAQEDMKTWIYE